ncbi:MAG: uroporphyrinogen-III C-methyltransferase [Rhodoferax sp.]|nr:uroporphyrinogen-III C-methyltransferase [Rhodoferax sp.]
MTADLAPDAVAAQAPSTDGAAISPQTSPDDAAQPARVLPRAWLVMLVGLTLVTLVATLLLWQKVSNMQEQLARQSAEAQSVSLEARALARQAVEVAQQTTARSAVLEVRLGEVALQRSQLDELMQSLSRSRDENLVVDIEAALRLAQQQAQLTGSVEPLLAALKSAEQRVARAAQPRLGLLQRALARDIDRVKSAAVSDTPSMLVKLDELVRLADDLVLANAVQPVRGRAEKPTAAASQLKSGWQTMLGLALEEARHLVRVSRVAAPDAVLLSPQQSFFVRENLKLTLLNARLTLLSRQVDATRADLRSAEGMLRKYFDVQSRNTQTAVALLQQLQQQTRNLQLPRVDDTLAVLATAAAGR